MPIIIHSSIKNNDDPAFKNLFQSGTLLCKSLFLRLNVRDTFFGEIGVQADQISILLILMQYFVNQDLCSCL